MEDHTNPQIVGVESSPAGNPQTAEVSCPGDGLVGNPQTKEENHPVDGLNAIDDHDVKGVDMTSYAEPKIDTVLNSITTLEDIKDIKVREAKEMVGENGSTKFLHENNHPPGSVGSNINPTTVPSSVQTHEQHPAQHSISDQETMNQHLINGEGETAANTNYNPTLSNSRELSPMTLAATSQEGPVVDNVDGLEPASRPPDLTGVETTIRFVDELSPNNCEQEEATKSIYQPKEESATTVGTESAKSTKIELATTLQSDPGSTLDIKTDEESATTKSSDVESTLTTKSDVESTTTIRVGEMSSLTDTQQQQDAEPSAPRAEDVESSVFDDPKRSPSPSAPPLPATSVGSRHSSSTDSLDSDVCKICHCGVEEAKIPLITPCLCCGTLKFVHKECLQKWIKNSDITECELCKFPYIMQSKTKPFTQWERLEMSSLERKKLFFSFGFHVIAIISVIWSLYVLIERTTEEVKTGEILWPFWTKLFVVAIGFTGGVAFMYIQCKVYVQLYNRWKAFNRIIEIQEPLYVPYTRKNFDCEI